MMNQVCSSYLTLPYHLLGRGAHGADRVCIVYRYPGPRATINPNALPSALP